jgi:two-component system, NtrC family, sensor kinase
MTKSLLRNMIQTLSKTDLDRTIQILIVEDEKIIALNLKENLQSLGYTVVALVASGEQAIEKAAKLHPDLVLMDICLKGNIDGITAAQQIWDSFSIPVIYVTGHSDQHTLERAKVSAPFGYILKPVKDRELYVAIETALQRYEREHLLSAILKGMGDGVIVIDPQLHIQFLNGVAQSLINWQLSEARERELSEVFKIVDQQTQLPLDNPAIAALQQDNTVSFKDHTLLISKKGIAIAIGGNATPIKDNNGMITGVVLVFRDITSSAQLEKTNLALGHALDELKRTQSQLIQSEKMSSVGQIAAAVVNEINNPVSIIYGNLPLVHQYLQDLLSLIEAYQQNNSSFTPEIRNLREKIDLDFLIEDWPQLMHSMQVAAERIEEIVLSLLSLSRFPQLDMLDLKPIDIHEGIDNTLRILQHRLRAEGKRPEIRVIKNYGQIPKVTCYASQLNQVFMQLLNNAIDALETQSSPHLITISTSIEKRKLEQPFNHPTLKLKNNLLSPSKEQNAYSQLIVIRIADNGCGMSEEVQKKIFDPFFTTKPVGSGTGLGLSISYQIVVDKHGGQLLCHSIPTQGTELVIELPIA